MKKLRPKPQYVYIPAGMSHHELANTYKAMVLRCCDQDHPKWRFYGARGIRVDPRWLGREGFLRFLQDMGERPPGKTAKGRPLFSVDRRNNDLGYGPSNCFWATASQQNRNKRYRKNGILQPSKPPIKRIRGYIIVVGESVLLNPDNSPRICKDVVEARHLARVYGGRHEDLKLFLDSRRAA